MVKNMPANAEDERDAGLIPGLERSPGGNPFQYSCIQYSSILVFLYSVFQYSCLKIPTDRRTW